MHTAREPTTALFATQLHLPTSPFQTSPPSVTIPNPTCSLSAASTSKVKRGREWAGEETSTDRFADADADAGGMEVTNPRRILAVSLEHHAEHLSNVVQALAGSPPSPASTSLAGTTHSLALRTPYYRADVPVWLDLVGSPAAWAASFLSDEAREVLAVLGGLVLVFPLPRTGPETTTTRELIAQVGSVVRDGLGGWEWDGVRLAVGLGGADDTDEWDGLCVEAGMEFVHVPSAVPRASTGDKGARNEFGEKVGVERLREALESNDWAQDDDDDALVSSDDFGDFHVGRDDGGSPKGDEEGAELKPEDLDFGFDRADWQGLKKAIWTEARHRAACDGDGDGDTDAAAAEEDGMPTRSKATGLDDNDDDDDDDEVAKVEGMMRRLQAVRDSSAGLGESQRRRMAARAVADVMREL
ncbi:hypothetical protein RJ55_04715 [Drechmeria coniospora]|nr:hypothetical protein RJ55_04715 [Drechmeria coniospora]